MTPQNLQAYTMREMVEYGNFSRNVGYWEGMLAQALQLKDEQEAKKSASNLRKAIKEYKENSSKEVLQRSNIYLRGLEAQCSRAD